MLLDQIENRREGVCLYGLTPPKLGQDPAKLRAIADRQLQRIEALAPDGLILYDLQDEAGRTGVERPFPFLPTLDPMEYARGYLAALPVPKVIYKCVGNLDPAGFLAWAATFPAARDALVLVGAPSSAPRPGSRSGSAPGSAGEGSQSFGLSEAYSLLANRPLSPVIGGIAIAERHARKGDEDARLMAKHASGCRFCISQTIFDANATKSMLSDYAIRFASAGLPPPPIILSFSPCGSLKTMEFMQWLGISFPRWLENELRHAPGILAKSMDLIMQVFTDIHAFARDKGIPIGLNIESVSIRKEEIDASCELFRQLASRFQDSRRTRP